MRFSSFFYSFLGSCSRPECGTMIRRNSPLASPSGRPYLPDARLEHRDRLEFITDLPLARLFTPLRGARASARVFRFREGLSFGGTTLHQAYSSIAPWAYFGAWLLFARHDGIFAPVKSHPQLPARSLDTPFPSCSDGDKRSTPSPGIRQLAAFPNPPSSHHGFECTKERFSEPPGKQSLRRQLSPQRKQRTQT